VGVTLAGLAEHVPGAAVVPAAQLNATEFAYPFAAVSLPLNVAFCPANTVCVEFVTVIE
jgi:hypothetical protein